MNKQILRLAIPSIVSNITVPLLGLVDTAIVGHMGVARYIGAIAVGSMMFNVIYWLFGFLRMGTGGLTAQAFGRNDMTEATMTGIRSLIISAVIGLSIIALQLPLFSLALWIISPDADVINLVWTYCKICVWGAPASLGLFALNGWFVGMQNTRIPMFVSIIQNLVNIFASIIFVYMLEMKIEGVALGTLIAQWTGAIGGLILFFRMSHIKKDSFPARRLKDGLRKFFTVNRDIFIRTVFLVAVNLYFVAAGAKAGVIILAVNTLLMQLFTLYSFVMDGFAYAAEALCGRYYGAQDKSSLHEAIKRVFFWSVVLTSLFTLVYVIGGQDFLSILTNERDVVAASRNYLPWAWLIPFCGLLPFVWDGIFIGTTMTRGMLLATCIGATVFFSVFLSLYPIMANHALWLAFILYLLSRGITQTLVWKVNYKKLL